MAFFFEIAFLHFTQRTTRKKTPHNIFVRCERVKIKKKKGFYAFLLLFIWCHDKLKLPSLKMTTETIIHNEITISWTTDSSNQCCWNRLFLLLFFFLPWNEKLELFITGMTTTTIAKRYKYIVYCILYLHKYYSLLAEEIKSRWRI